MRINNKKALVKIHNDLFFWDNFIDFSVVIILLLASPYTKTSQEMFKSLDLII